jgi:hypothetical protein
MGGGASSREKELQAQNNALQAKASQTIQQYQPSALEQRQEKDAMDWYDFTDGKSGAVDYSKAGGLIHLGMFDQAKANRFAERTATGGLQMGKDGANPTAVAMAKDQMANQFNENQGMDMVNAVRMKDAQVRGDITPFLIGTSEARNQSKMGATTGMANSTTSSYASLPQKQAWWETALVAGLGAAGSAFQGKA